VESAKWGGSGRGAIRAPRGCGCYFSNIKCSGNVDVNTGSKAKVTLLSAVCAGFLPLRPSVPNWLHFPGQPSATPPFPRPRFSPDPLHSCHWRFARPGHLLQYQNVSFPALKMIEKYSLFHGSAL